MRERTGTPLTPRPVGVVLVGASEVEATARTVDDLVERTRGPATARWASEEPELAARRNSSPLAVLVERDDEVVAAAHLTSRTRRGVTTFSGAGRADEPAWLPAVDPDAAVALADVLVDHVSATSGPWRLRLNQLPAGDPVVARMVERLRTARLVDGGASVELRFREGAALGDYVSANTRKAVAKAVNRIAREGHRLRIAWSAEPEQITGLMEQVVTVHRERNLQLRGRSALDDRAQAAVFEETVLAHARAGRCRLLTLHVDEDLAAFAIGLVSGGSLYVYANLVSPRYLRFSAGRVANAEVVRMAHADPGIDRVDWGPGPQRYKLSGDSTVQPLVVLNAWSSPMFRSLAAAVGRGRLPLATFAHAVTYVVEHLPSGPGGS